MTSSSLLRQLTSDAIDVPDVASMLLLDASRRCLSGCISSMLVGMPLMHPFDVIDVADVAMLSMQFSASVFDVSDAFDVAMMLMHSC